MKRVLGEGKVKEIKTRKRNIVKDTECWSNNSVKIVDTVRCFVPKKIEDIMEVLNDKFTGKEYSIFATTIFDERLGKLVVQEDYYIPKQIVSGASVDYKEDAPEGFNTVIHKHPTGCRQFSSTDNTYINQNFDYSLLWEGGRFVTGQVRAETVYGLIALKIQVETNFIKPNIEIENINNIEIFKPAPVHTFQHSNNFKNGKPWGCEDYTDYLSSPQHLKALKGHIPEAPSMLFEEEIPRNKLKGALLNKDLEEVQSSCFGYDIPEDPIEDYYEIIQDYRDTKANDGQWLTWEEAVNLYDEEYGSGLRLDNPVKIEA